jgi:N-acetylmuramoyl-L-alanine amidase
MPEPNELLRRLATIYADAEIAHPRLRAVTLAQWMLESGRATSALAKLHFNFGGLKWRPEMAGIATRITFEAHDGVDRYCKFATIENFIEGYWAFINRAPYSGWEAHTASGEDYIRFIGPIYTPSSTYVGKVLNLVPEAEGLLAAAGMPEAGTSLSAGSGANLGTIVLDPGHGGTQTVGGSSPNNAISVSGVKEKQLALEFCLLLRELLLKEAQRINKQLKVVMTRTSDINVGVRARANVVRDNKGKLLVVIHFNGNGNSSIRGTETFFRAASNGNTNLAEDKDFCQVVQTSLVNSLKAIDPGAKDRGVKPDTDTVHQSLGILRDADLGNNTLVPKARAAYAELEFITNNKVEKQLISGPDAVANRKMVMGNLAKELVRYAGTF